MGQPTLLNSLFQQMPLILFRTCNLDIREVPQITWRFRALPCQKDLTRFSAFQSEGLPFL